MQVLGMIMAGGHGTRLHPLTALRSKPAVPFGAKYRIIDFVLNNFVNSGIYSIYVLTQFRAQSLTDHIQRHWRFGAFLDDHFISLAPAQMFRFEELGSAWYRGTADAVYQNSHLIDTHNPELVAVFGGDHIYKMNIAHMVSFMREKDADIVIAGYSVPITEAKRFGVLQVDSDWKLSGFDEKPTHPKMIPGQPDRALVSMGNYIFRTQTLRDVVREDAKDQSSTHDFGRDVLPAALASGRRIFVYDFQRNPIPGQDRPNTYWRDVGTLDSYFEASMDLVQVVPEFDLYNTEWPLRTANRFSPPTKFVFEAGETQQRVGAAYDSLIAGGCIISGAVVRQSILFRRVRLHSYSAVTRTVLLDEVDIGRHCRIQNAIIDKYVQVPPNTEIGFDLEADRARGMTITEGGIVIVPKGFRF